MSTAIPTLGAWLGRLMAEAFPPHEATFWLTHRLRSSPRFWGL